MGLTHSAVSGGRPPRIVRAVRLGEDRSGNEVLRIATWNINGLRARLEFLIHWLRARRPDIVGLQELKSTDDEFPRLALEGEGYRAVVHGQKAWNGVAILSRKPAQVKQSGLPGQEQFGARLITAEIEGLSFTTLYCPNGKHLEHGDFPRKLSWLDGLRDYLEQCFDSGDPVVFCGDFNICPTALDSWDEAEKKGTIFHTDQERFAFQRLLGWGLKDVYRTAHPDRQAFSWWDYRGGSFHQNRGLRIDFLLATDPVAKRVRSAEIDREYRKKKEGMTASDHAPVIADLE